MKDLEIVQTRDLPAWIDLDSVKDMICHVSEGADTHPIPVFRLGESALLHVLDTPIPRCCFFFTRGIEG